MISLENRLSCRPVESTIRYACYDLFYTRLSSAMGRTAVMLSIAVNNVPSYLTVGVCMYGLTVPTRITIGLRLSVLP